MARAKKSKKQLERLAEATEEDALIAASSWRAHAPAAAKALIDSETITDADDRIAR